MVFFASAHPDHMSLGKKDQARREEEEEEEEEGEAVHETKVYNSCLHLLHN